MNVRVQIQRIAKAFEVRVPGGAIRCGRLDSRGEATITALIEGRCFARFPELTAGSWGLCETTPLASP